MKVSGYFSRLMSNALILLNDRLVTWAFDIHKIGVWTLHKSFFLVSPPFLLGARVQQILCKLKGHKILENRRLANIFVVYSLRSVSSTTINRIYDVVDGQRLFICTWCFSCHLMLKRNKFGENRPRTGRSKQARISLPDMSQHVPTVHVLAILGPFSRI